MSNLVPRDQRGLDVPLGTWRQRYWASEQRFKAQLAEFEEIAEAARIDTRMNCARKLADRAAAELAFVHDEFTQLAGGNPATELDLRDFEKVLKVGYARLLHDYLGRR